MYKEHLNTIETSVRSACKPLWHNRLCCFPENVALWWFFPVLIMWIFKRTFNFEKHFHMIFYLIFSFNFSLNFHLIWLFHMIVQYDIHIWSVTYDMHIWCFHMIVSSAGSSIDLAWYQISFAKLIWYRQVLYILLAFSHMQ